jgi:DNA-binding MarR family transcriptional regulator
MQANVKAEAAAPAAAAARGADGEPLTELELGAWRGLLRAHAGMVRRLDADLRARHGITLTSYEALMLVGDAPHSRMRISELSSATLLSISGMSRMIDRLEREGLVTREPCEDDGRGWEVALTPSGRGRLRAARASHLAGVRAEFLERFDDDELAQLGEMWGRITPPGEAGA